METFQRVSSGAPWEEKVGYCRAIKVAGAGGGLIAVTGTTGIGEDGRVVSPRTATSPGDGYLQARRCIEIIRVALEGLGADQSRVVRTRMYVTDISR
ncbi:MAG: hypothetical protein KF745_09085 [Phycisphaeraceae bacterium]|nr:hypothetical protein [Phycisphaeraceae bacterium]